MHHRTRMPDSCRCLHARAPPPSFTIAIQACASSNNTDQVLLKATTRVTTHVVQVLRVGQHRLPSASLSQRSRRRRRIAQQACTRAYTSLTTQHQFFCRGIPTTVWFSFPLFPFPACIIYASICRGVPKFTGQQQPTPSSFVHRRRQRVTFSTTQATAAPSY